jgi:hypothetical protein
MPEGMAAAFRRSDSLAARSPARRAAAVQGRMGPVLFRPREADGISEREAPGEACRLIPILGR